MAAGLEHADQLRPGPAASRIRVENWTARSQEDAAHLIAAAYQGHVDGEVNDQYRSAAGARRFLMNIIQYPGCGAFFQPGSYLAFHPDNGRLCGLSLSSLVAVDVGHITQICAAPWAKGSGVGYELLRHTMQALARHGCRKVSLTVTATNSNAIRLYERVGFSTHRRFTACVWEGS